MKGMLGLLALVAVLLAVPAFAQTQPAAAPKVFARLPVKEVTVFKDGYALVVHEGRLATDAAGDVSLDRLPAPVLGTFWPYALPGAALKSVSAGRQRVALERTALSLREMIEANTGAEVMVTEKPTAMKEGRTYMATILGIPERSASEREATEPESTPPLLPTKSDFVLLKTPNGTQMTTLEQIQGLTFINQPKTRATNEEIHNLLTLHLDWAGKAPQKEAGVGLAYLQSGLRWIPSYKVELDGAGKAKVKFQATLVNELADLEGVTANLVIGVPTVAFKDMTDPVALGQEVARLATQPSRFNAPGANFLSNSLSNAIQSQVAMPVEPVASAPAPSSRSLGPEIPGGNKNEELFLFTLRDVTLQKGGTLVLPVAEFELNYEDVYTLEIPEAPPRDVLRGWDITRQSQAARALAAPKVKHVIRIKNDGTAPLTTAPALLTREGRLLGQALLTYTAPGAASDVEVGTAVDIAVRFEDKETKRIPNAERWNDQMLTRIELAGTIRLANHRKEPVTVEVRRYVLGHADTAEQQGTVTMLNVFGDSSGAQVGSTQPEWWGWYDWPAWWSSFNGRGRIEWKKTLEPGKPLELGYTWHYFWR